MNKKQLIAITALTTIAAATTLCLLSKRKHKKRLVTVSDAGYETAWDVHFPTRYRLPARGSAF